MMDPGVHVAAPTPMFRIDLCPVFRVSLEYQNGAESIEGEIMVILYQLRPAFRLFYYGYLSPRG